MTFTDRELLANGVDQLLVQTRRWRRDHKLTQAQFGRMVGIDASTLCAAECGKRPLSRAARAKLAAWYEKQRQKPLEAES